MKKEDLQEMFKLIDSYKLKCNTYLMDKSVYDEIVEWQDRESYLLCA